MNWLALTSREKSSFILPVLLRIFPRRLPRTTNCGERWKSLRAAGAMGTVTIMNPASMDIPWSRVSVNRNHPSMDLADAEFNETPASNWA